MLEIFISKRLKLLFLLSYYSTALPEISNSIGASGVLQYTEMVR